MIVVRLSTAADITAVQRIDDSSFPACDPDAVPAEPGELEAGVSGGEILVATNSDVVVGFLHRGDDAPGRTTLRALAVSPGHRRRGAGRLLVDRALHDTIASSAQRFPWITTVTALRNRPMITLLTRRGFVVDSLLLDHFGPGRHRFRLTWNPVLAAALRTNAPTRRLATDDVDALRRHLGGGEIGVRVEGRADGTFALSFARGAPPNGRLDHRPHLPWRHYSASSNGDSMQASGLTATDRAGDEEHVDVVVDYARDAAGRTTPTTVGLEPTGATLQPVAPPTDAAVSNQDAPWDDFNPEAYWKRNYSQLLPADRHILEQISIFFSREVRGPFQRGIDIGAGTNLYPALAMLPYVDTITLADYSAANVRWLRDKLSDPISPWPWESFWEILQKHRPASEPVRSAREELRARASVEQRSVLTLPTESWDVGTMFFVAESITSQRDEFDEAVGRFVRALRPGAPFAAAFMAGSNGYRVDNSNFPAIPVSEEDIVVSLEQVTTSFTTEFIPKDDEDHVRDPSDPTTYDGMVLALGFTERRP